MSEHLGTNRSWRGPAIVALLIAAALGGAGTVYAGPEGRCLSVSVDSSISLPDGSTHPPGLLTLCDSTRYSPVASLHKTYVDGMPVGMLLSNRRAAEGSGPAVPTVMFHRDDAGILHLFGYVMPAGERSVTYLLARPGRGGIRDTTALARSSSPVSARESLVLAAAKTHR